MPFETVKQETNDTLPEALQKLTFDKPHRLRTNKDGVQKGRKKKEVVTRPGYGPFNLAKGAKVKRIITNWQEAIPFFEQEDCISLDLETGGLSFLHDHIFVMGLYGPKTETACIVHTPDGNAPEGLISWLESNPNRLFITQNGVCFDIPFLHFAGLKWDKMKWFDTLIAEQAITQTNRSGVPKDLQAITKRRLGIDISKNVDHRDWYNEILSEDQIRYVAEDISFLPDIRERQYEKAREVEKNWGINPIYNTSLTDAIDLEMALAPTVIRMQNRGLPIDEDAVWQYFQDQIQESASAGIRLTEALGEINFSSPAQIKRAFKDRYDVDLLSTTEDHVIEVRDLFTGSPIYQIFVDLLTYKHAAKRASVYNGNFLLEYTKDGWLHGNFSQLGANTGRFSSRNPNLQQLPKDKGSGGGARHLIGNREGLSIVSIDYSQIEFRVAANIAGDEAAFELFAQSHYDIHTMVASAVFGVPPNEVTKDQRQLSKAMSFTLLFGGGAYLLSRYASSLGAELPLAKAKPIVIDFFDKFEGLARLRNKAYAIAAKGNPFTIQLPTGLRRVLIPNQDLKATLILNNMVQGTAAAGLKYALLLAQERKLDRFIGAVVHDEIVAAVPSQIAEAYANDLRNAMIEGMVKVCEQAKVEAEINIGKTWG